MYKRQELKRDVILDILPGQERPEVDDYLRFIHPISVYATDSYIYTLNLDMTTEEMCIRDRGKENVDFRIKDTEYKIVAYVDSAGCTSCKSVSYTHLPSLS